MNATIITNNVPRDLIYWYDLTAKEQRDYDYLETEDEQDGAVFFRYRGNTYSLGEILRAGATFPNWDGYFSDSFFSGILVRLVDDGDRVVVGTFIS